MATFAPFRILKDAIKQVPALKYALGIVGIVSAISIISTLVTDFRVAVFGTLIMILLMIFLVIFAKLTTIQTGEIRIIILVLMWFSLFLIIATSSCLFTSVFFKWPVDLQNWITRSNSVQTGTSADDEQQAKIRSIEQAYQQDSDIRLVDCTISSEESPDGLPMPPVIDIKVRNVGSKIAFLKRAGLEILGDAKYEDCRQPKYNLVPSSWTYNLDIEKSPIINISQSLPPNEVDRFQIKVGRERGHAFTVYKVQLFIKYNETDQTVNSTPFFIEMQGPAFVAGAFMPPVTEQQWKECVERNRKNFGEIGYKIYKDDK